MDLVPLLPPIWAWIALELFLGIRDIVRRKGSAADDRGTRVLISLGFFAAYGGAIAAALWLYREPGWQLGNWHLITGEIVAWAGLAIRLWAVIVLGSAFRLTVEVDTDQTVVDGGPYRWVRHPSYTGLLVLAVGFGLALGNWLSLALLVLIPTLVLLRRIRVEEAHLTAVLGESYVEYQARTRRLIPWIW